MCVCIHIHIHAHTQMYVSMHVYIHVCVSTHTYRMCRKGPQKGPIPKGPPERPLFGGEVFFATEKPENASVLYLTRELTVRL